MLTPAAEDWSSGLKPSTANHSRKKLPFKGDMSSCQPPRSEPSPAEQGTNTPLSLLEQAAGVYARFQKVIPGLPEAHAGPAGGPQGVSVTSPRTSAQALDLSVSSEEQCPAVGGETPVSYSLVPISLLDRISSEENPSTMPGSVLNRRNPASSVKVCLEKRFSTLCVENSALQDIQFLPILQQSAEPQNAVLHLEKPRNETVVALVESTLPQPFILPNTFALNFQPDMVVAKTSNSINAAQAKRPRRRTQPYMSVSQRKEMHNLKERERRKNIRLYCDELNTLVPFCNTNTDKVTTLQWTVTFLKYVTELYGDTLKEEFTVKLRSSLTEADDPQVVPLRVEQ